MRVWGWSGLSQVERVDLYTRQSLYLLLWGSVAVVVLGNSNEARGDEASYAVVAGGALILALAATAVLRDVTDLYPATGPLPWRTMTPFLLLALMYYGFGQGLADELRGAATAVVFGTVAWSLGGLRDTRACVVLVSALSVLPAVSARSLVFAPAGLLIALLFIFTVRVSLWLLEVVIELERARHAQAALAVAEERLRFSRDVHDVLGRRLSTIAVQSELAATLAERGDEHARERMLEVRAVAHEALREARELARGYRATDLGNELEGARSLLRSAGIEVRLDVDGLPERWQEAAAWVVREAVTNVLRHSSASRVSIEYADGELAVTNDGVVGAGSEGGSGLAGLRERLAPLGVELTAARDDTSFAVVATLPGGGPDEDAR